MDDAIRNGADDRRERRIDVASASLLAIATVLAAWSAFQSAKWSGEQATAYAEASGLRQESVRASTLAGQQLIIDVTVFEQVVDAFAAGDRRLEDFYRERARAEFEPALEAWIAQARDDIERAPSTPFALPEYELAATLESEELQHRAEARFRDALDNNQRSDNYVLLAVLFASVLLFAGLAPKSRSYPVQAAMIVLAVVVLVIGLGFLIAFPKTF
ncbi:MAG TPA: hypothetical protein VH950_16720 [Gaiellaceae bacterium]